MKLIIVSGGNLSLQDVIALDLIHREHGPVSQVLTVSNSDLSIDTWSLVNKIPLSQFTARQDDKPSTRRWTWEQLREMAIQAKGGGVALFPGEHMIYAMWLEAVKAGLRIWDFRKGSNIERSAERNALKSSGLFPVQDLKEWT